MGLKVGSKVGLKKISIRIKDSKKRQELNGNSKRCTRGINVHIVQNGGEITEIRFIIFNSATSISDHVCTVSSVDSHLQTSNIQTHNSFA